MKSKKNKKPFKNSLTKNGLLILGILVVGYIVIVLSLRFITRHNNELSVPDFAGMTVEKAELLADAMHLRLDVTDSVYIRGMERGVISRQNPIAGSKVKKDRRILLVINSIAPQMSEVPSVVGLSLRQAKTELMANGLNVGKLIYVTDLATNNVLAQKINGEDVEPGTQVVSYSSIDLVLGLNPDNNTTYVPNLIGYKYLLAKEFLQDYSLNLHRPQFDETVVTYSDSLEAVVYGQFPQGSDSVTYYMGSPVTLYLSKDLSRIPVPQDTVEAPDAEVSDFL